MDCKSLYVGSIPARASIWFAKTCLASRTIFAAAQELALRYFMSDAKKAGPETQAGERAKSDAGARRRQKELLIEMQIRYTARSPEASDIVVTGTREDFAELATLIELADGKLIAVKPMPAGSPAPSDQFLQYIVIRSAPGRAVYIRHFNKSVLLIEGDKSKLAILAATVRVFGEEERETHRRHIAYFPHHFYLDPESHAMELEFYRDSLVLSDKWVPILKLQPETGTGYQIGSVYLKNGKHFKGVRIIEGRISSVRDERKIPFTEAEIDKILIDHGK